MALNCQLTEHISSYFRTRFRKPQSANRRING